MQNQLIQLFPPPSGRLPLKGLYLNLELHKLGSISKPFIYANFVSSIDGRIALNNNTGKAYVPKTLTSDEDFRLFLELESQADCLITHSGYMRDLAEGNLGNILQIGAHKLGRDLPSWRKEKGLSPQPALIVATSSLDFPIPETIKESGQTIHIITTAKANPDKIKNWRDSGYEVRLSGVGDFVTGSELSEFLVEKGYRSAYLIAGPKILETMVRDRMLSCLFHTTTHCMLGGEHFWGMVNGKELEDSGLMRLSTLYFIPEASNKAGQCFARYDCQ